MREFLTQSPLHLVFAGFAALSVLCSAALSVRAALGVLRRSGGRHAGQELLWTLVPALALLLVTLLCAAVPLPGHLPAGGRAGEAQRP